MNLEFFDGCVRSWGRVGVLGLGWPIVGQADPPKARAQNNSRSLCTTYRHHAPWPPHGGSVLGSPQPFWEVDSLDRPQLCTSLAGSEESETSPSILSQVLLMHCLPGGTIFF